MSEFTLCALLLGAIFPAQAAITLVQHASTDGGTTTSSSLAFAGSNTAGNWIAVVVRAGGSSNQVFTVSDSNRNTYRKAVQLAVTVDTPNGDSLAIFYAESIAGGANTVKVSDTVSATLRIAIFEYSGVAGSSSIDQVASAQGTSTSPNSGSLTTTTNGDLLLAGILSADPETFTAGSGYTEEEEVPAEPNTKLLAEQQIQTTAGSASASASLSSTDPWGAVLASFHAAASGTAPAITNLSPTSGMVGTPVTISGTNFGTSGTVTFNGTAATPTSWSATSIVALVPSAATTGNVVVTVAGAPSNGVTFTVLPPSGGITLIQHNSKDGGTTTSSSLAFAGSNTAGNWIAVIVRAGGSLNQVFTVSDSKGNMYRKAVQLAVTVDTPNGDSLAIFYAESIAGGANAVTVSDTVSATLRIAIFEYSGVAASSSIDQAASAQGTSTSPNSGSLTTTTNGDLLLAGILSADAETFTAGSGYTEEEEVPAEPNTKLLAEQQIQTTAGATSANASLSSTDPWGAVLASFHAVATGVTGPAITNLSPTSGKVGTAVTISGTNFGTPGTVTFNGTVATPTGWSATSIAAPVPTGATTGNVVVTVGGTPSNGVSFTVLSGPPAITTLNPTSGAVGTAVTISGTNFGTTGTVTFNGAAATPTSWSNASIVAPVPAGASTGSVVVTVGGTPSTGVSFTVLPPSSAITLIQHTSKDGGTTTSTSLAFTANNTAGNWIAVVVRAGGSSNQIFTVGDSKGNTYRQAVQLPVTVDTPNGDSLAIYYAESIAGGANTVTVSDTVSATLRLAILEYSGVAETNSLDETASAQGTGEAANSGSLTSTANGDLLLSGILSADADTFTAGTGYAEEEEIPAEPNTKLLVEQQIQTTAGSVTAAATLAGADPWGAVLAAFKSMSGAVQTPVGVFPASLTFNGQVINSASSPQTVTVSNTGAAVANLTISITGNFTVATNGCGSSISGDSTCPIGVTFMPNALGTQTGMLSIVDSISGNTHLVSLTGAGVSVNGETYALSVSISSDRTFGGALQGATLQGYNYVFTSLASQLTNYDPTGISSVSYWLDNPGMTGSPMHTASSGPTYDFLGVSNVLENGLAVSWNTAALADGTHSITQLVTKSGGATEVDTATFVIQNNLPATFTTGHYVYVVVDENIYVYSLDNPFQLVKHVNIPQAVAIQGVDAVPSTHTLYIAYGGNGGVDGNGSLLAYNLLTDTVIWTQNYSFGTDSFSITPDGSTIYMPDGVDSTDGVWYVLSASNGDVIGSIDTGMNGAHNTIASLDGTSVFMGPINSDFLVKASTSTNNVVLDIGPLYEGVRPFTINGKSTLAFTTASTVSGHELGFQVSNTATGEVLYSVTVPGFSVPSGFSEDASCHGISLSPDETELYLIDIANLYVHVFDVSGLPSTAPTLVANIPLTTTFTNFESPCLSGFDCGREGWLLHTLDGHYVMVGDSGNVIDTTLRQVVGTIPVLLNTHHGNIEIDWSNGVPISTSTHYGLGYVTQ